MLRIEVNSGDFPYNSAFALYGLSVLLPKINFDAGPAIVDPAELQGYATLISNIIGMMQNPDFIYRKAILKCMRGMLSNKAEIIIMLECQIIPVCAELLSCSDVTIRTHACNVISFYSKNIPIEVLRNESLLVVNTIRLLYEEKTLRHPLIEILNNLLEQAGEVALAEFVSKNVFKAVLNLLAEFKDYDPFLRELYGYTEATYKFPLLISALKFLLNSLLKASQANPEAVLAVCCQFDRFSLEKLKIVLNVLYEDTKTTKIDFVDITTYFMTVGLHVTTLDQLGILSL
jgi:hypothetical protein